MKLGADAMHLTGRVLLPKGAELTDKHIKLFKQWGVVEAEVEADGDVQEETVISPKIMEKEKEKLTLLMKHVDLKHPLIAELYRLLLKRNVEAASKPGVKNELDS